MKIRNKTDFLQFNDGFVTLYRTNDDDEIIRNTAVMYRFGNRKLGVNRFYAAKQNDIELSRVIHIHRNPDVTTQYAAVINRTRFKIEQVQHDDDSNPRSTVLSLSQRGLWEGKA